MRFYFRIDVESFSFRRVQRNVHSLKAVKS
jgi:hypothetical protein